MSRLVTKYYEATLPPHLQHMAYIRPYLKVTEHDDSTKSFTYRKTFVAKSIAVEKLKQ